MGRRPRGMRAAVGATAAATLLMLCGSTVVSSAAGAATTGSIAGTVAAPPGTQIVVTVCAIAEGGQESCAATLATNLNANVPGAYRISGLPSGEYKLGFVARCAVEPCPDTFPPEYYDNQISLAKATPIELSAAEALVGIDASIEDDEERGVREYIEKEGLAPPSQPGERTVTMPGAIEPLPVNKKLEEEFWAHPPWDRGTTSAPSALGMAVAVSPAAVQGARAEISVHCTGASACRGVLALVATITGEKVVKRDGKRIRLKQLRNILIGTTGFSLAATTSETLGVHLTRIGQELIRTAGKKMLRVKLTGSGIRSGPLVLKQVTERARPMQSHPNTATRLTLGSF
jgi:hypothetical protein